MQISDFEADFDADFDADLPLDFATDFDADFEVFDADFDEDFDADFDAHFRFKMPGWARHLGTCSSGRLQISDQISRLHERFLFW